MSEFLTRLWRRRAERAKTAQEAALEEAQRLLDYRMTFGTDHGRRVLADILRRARVVQSSYAGADTHATAFAEGRRRVGLEIIETVNRDPEAVDRMMRTGQVEELFNERDDDASRPD